MKRFDTFRDVLILCPEDAGADVLVTAVDSCGAIGEKPGDVVRAAPECAAEHTARVALLEVASTGAKLVFCTLNVCNGPADGERMLAGVQKALPHTPVVMSTEKNMPTCMSAFGVSVTGICKPEEMRLGHAKAGDQLFCAGVPLVGEEVLSPRAACFGLAHLDTLFKDAHVHAVIPCGSQGIAKEAYVIASESALIAILDNESRLDLKKSAGPATCAVFAADRPTGHDFKLGLPVACIGRLAAVKD